MWSVRPEHSKTFALLVEETYIHDGARLHEGLDDAQNQLENGKPENGKPERSSSTESEYGYSSMLVSYTRAALL